MNVLDAASVDDLRKVVGAAGDVAVTATPAGSQLFRWVAVATDDGSNGAKPDPAKPEGWDLFATVATPVDGAWLVLAVPWVPPRGAVRLSAGWVVVGADAANIYIARAPA